MTSARSFRSAAIRRSLASRCPCRASSAAAARSRCSNPLCPTRNARGFGRAQTPSARRWIASASNREQRWRLPTDSSTRNVCLFLRLHELIQHSCNLIGFGIKREVSRVEYMNPRVRYVLAETLRLADIERGIVLAPEDQKLWLRLL